MDHALRAMLTATVTIAPFLSEDAYGTPTFGTAVSYPARVDGSGRRFVTAQGEERVSRARIFLDAEAVVDLRSQLTLPDGSRPTMQQIETFTDERGIAHHLEILV